MNWADWCIVGLLALSVLLGLLRGFFREVATLVVWVGAFVVATAFGDLFAARLETYVSEPSVRAAAAWVLLFIAVLIVGAIVTHFIVELIRRSPVSGTDRMLGSLFGLARGGLLVAALVFFAALTPVKQDPWWQESKLVGLFEDIAARLAEFVPQSWLDRLKTQQPITAPAAGGEGA